MSCLAPPPRDLIAGPNRETNRESEAGIRRSRLQTFRPGAGLRNSTDGHLQVANPVHAGMIKRLLREPLLHFLLLGAVLFAAHGLLSRSGASEPGSIVVTQGQIESMARLFARARQRPPSNAELEELVRGHIREEVFYREGLSLGLDRDDPIIRRRVAQKLEFVTEAPDAVEPDDAQLQAYLDSHGELFAVEPRYSFRHIYLDPRRRQATLVIDAERILGELNGPGSSIDAAGLGDPSTLPLDFYSASASEIKNSLGNEFAKALARLAPGPWSGPVSSGSGMHLVQVRQRTEPRAPDLADVREAVKREWLLTRRAEAVEKSYRNLLQRYTVTVEPSRLARSTGDSGSKRQP